MSTTAPVTKVVMEVQSAFAQYVGMKSNIHLSVEMIARHMPMNVNCEGLLAKKKRLLRRSRTVLVVRKILN